MKIKHNKKRNTAFVYEALVREGTSAILQKDDERRNKIVLIIKAVSYTHLTLPTILRV